MRRVLDDREPPPVRDREHGVHVAGIAAVMEDKQRLGSRAQGGFEVLGIQVEIARPLDVAEDG